MPSPELIYIYTFLGLILGMGHLMATRDLLASVEFGMTSIGAICAFHAVLDLMISIDKT